MTAQGNKSVLRHVRLKDVTMHNNVHAIGAHGLILFIRPLTHFHHVHPILMSGKAVAFFWCVQLFRSLCC